MATVRGRRAALLASLLALLAPRRAPAGDTAKLHKGDYERFKCEALGMLCAGKPVENWFRDSLERALQGTTENAGDAARCMLLGLFDCQSPRAFLGFPVRVTHPERDGFEDRYFTLRRVRYRPGAGVQANASTAFCLFFRRRVTGDVFDYMTCEVCSRDSLRFDAEPRCIDPANKVWRGTKFRHTLHHNFAVPDHAAQGSGRLLQAFGGQYPGIWHLSAARPVLPSDGPVPTHEWHVQPHVEISRFHAGCVDLMAGWYGMCTWSNLMRVCRYPNCGCELDGRLSVVHFRGRLLLYARANLRPGGGGRFVQVSSSDDGVGPGDREFTNTTWQPFNLINILDYDAWQGDVYTFAVHANPADPETLLAIFPVVDRSVARSSIAMSVSEDGVWWSPMVDLISSMVSSNSAGRTMDHPFEGLLVSPAGDEVYVYVQHTVPGVAVTDWDRPRRLWRYHLPMATLEELTGAGRVRLADARREHVELRESVEGRALP